MNTITERIDEASFNFEQFVRVPELCVPHFDDATLVSYTGGVACYNTLCVDFEYQVWFCYRLKTPTQFEYVKGSLNRIDHLTAINDSFYRPIGTNTMSRTLKDLLLKNPSIAVGEILHSQFSKEEKGMLERRLQALVDDSETAALIVAHDAQLMNHPLPPSPQMYGKIQ